MVLTADNDENPNETNLGDVKDHDIDAFGDAYEYLLTRLDTVGKTEINKVSASDFCGKPQKSFSDRL